MIEDFRTLSDLVVPHTGIVIVFVDLVIGTFGQTEGS